MSWIKLLVAEGNCMPGFSLPLEGAYTNSNQKGGKKWIDGEWIVGTVLLHQNLD